MFINIILSTALQISICPMDRSAMYLEWFFFVAKGPNTSEEIPGDVIVGESNEKLQMDDLIEVTDESEDEIQFKSKGGTYI